MGSAKSFVLLLDADDLACIEATRPEALSGDVLAFDIDVHLLLQDRGIEHVTPWDVVGVGEWERLRAFELALWDFWTRRARAEFEGINLLDMSRYRHRSCFSRMAWAAYVIGRALERLRPGRVVVFEEARGHGLNPPDDYNKMPVLFMLLRGMAEQCGIEVDLITEAEQAARPQYVDLIARAGERTLEPVGLGQVLRGREFVLLAGSGVDLVRQLPLIRRINEDGRYVAVQLYKTANERILSAMREAGHIFWHDSQVTERGEGVGDRGLANEALREFDAACGEAPDELRCVFGNGRLRPHFEFIFGTYIRKMAEHVRAWKGFFERLRPAALVVNSVAPINDVAVHLRIPGMVAAHSLMRLGFVEPFGSFPGLHLGAISGPHRDKLVAAGLPAEFVHVTGDPQIDEILSMTQRRSDGEGPRLMRELRSRLGVADGQRMILLATGGLGIPAQMNHLPYIDWAGAARSFEDIGELAGRRGEWRWVVKCHPRFDHPALYERVNRRLPVDRRIIVLREGSLDEMVLGTDAAVMVNIITSALIEGSFRPRPIMVLNQSIPWYSPSEWGMQHWPHPGSVAELEAELDAIFSDPRVYQGRVEQSGAALRGYLGGEPTSSVSRCVDLIYEIAGG